jgi:hypothetical protein
LPKHLGMRGKDWIPVLQSSLDIKKSKKGFKVFDKRTTIEGKNLIFVDYDKKKLSIRTNTDVEVGDTVEFYIKDE